MALDIGRVTYEGYRKFLAEFHKEIVPVWEELSRAQLDAWRHAGCAVIKYLDKEQESLSKNVMDQVEGEWEELSPEEADLLDPKDRYYDVLADINNELADESAAVGLSDEDIQKISEEKW